MGKGSLSHDWDKGWKTTWIDLTQAISASTGMFIFDAIIIK